MHSPIPRLRTLPTDPGGCLHPSNTHVTGRGHHQDTGPRDQSPKQAVAEVRDAPILP